MDLKSSTKLLSNAYHGLTDKIFFFWTLSIV